jgi:hypothetical protein
MDLSPIVYDDVTGHGRYFYRSGDRVNRANSPANAKQSGQNQIVGTCLNLLGADDIAHCGTPITHSIPADDEAVGRWVASGYGGLESGLTLSAGECLLGCIERTFESGEHGCAAGGNYDGGSCP